jgi:hypothetical protein
VTMAYLMLYGSGWTQRWRIAEGNEQQISEEINRVGQDDTSPLSVLDPGSDAPATLVVHWAQVAAAVLLDSGSGTPHDEATGQYA